MVKSAAIDGERDQYRRGSKPTRAILVCPWKKHFTALNSSAWQLTSNPDNNDDKQVILNFDYISKYKLKKANKKF